MGALSSGLVFLGFITKQAQQAKMSKLAAALLQGLCIFACFQVPILLSFSTDFGDILWYDIVRWSKLSLSQGAFGHTVLP